VVAVALSFGFLAAASGHSTRPTRHIKPITTRTTSASTPKTPATAPSTTTAPPEPPAGSPVTTTPSTSGTLSGVYAGAGDRSDTQALATWRGSPVTIVSDYLD